jgi:Ca-activated chloride channel family protein
MLARDMPERDLQRRDPSPTRLERSAEAIRSFLDAGGGFRFGVVLFRREAACVLPVTEDRHAVRVLVDHLSPALMTPSGTNLERGIRRSLDSFETAGRFRAVILFTDGDDRSGDPAAAARVAGSRGIPLIPVAAGTEAGSMILLDDGSPVRDAQGRMVVSRLDRGVLEEIAQLSGGRVYEVDRLGRLHRDLPGLMKGLEAGETHRGLKLERRTRYRLFLFLAVLMLMLSILIRSLRWRNTL